MNGKNAKLARKAANEAATRTGRDAANGMLHVLEYTRKVEFALYALADRVSALEGKPAVPPTDEQ